MAETFQGLVLNETDRGVPTATVQALSTDWLMPGDVLVAVQYSDLNYKDGLALLGKNKVVRQYPMIPGIDFVGTVADSRSPLWKSGDQVILTGWGVGERHHGGFAQMAQVKGEWLVPLPKGLAPLQAMALGTAGLTAMLCVLALEQQNLKRGRPVLVTGAAGGVGSVATWLLAQRGYIVHASTGRQEEAAYLKRLGAEAVIPRLQSNSRPLEREAWGGAVDTVGGETLAALISQLSYGCSVAACGLAGGSALHTSVIPFILRGVRLLGVDSVQCPVELRTQAWNELAQAVKQDPETVDEMSQVVALEDVVKLAPLILQGQIRGRTVVDVHAPSEEGLMTK